MTSEQLEAARAERLRQNAHGALTLEDARTWIEETGLSLFLPKKQNSASVAPSFVEAVAGHRNPNPDPKHIALAEELLVRLELDGVAVRLNLLGLPGEQPDYVVAGWVLPYVYALRGDRDWRRTPQLTGSRQVSPLAVQAYKLLEAADTTIPHLTHALGREVTETAVLRAITELWQQLRIIPVIDAPGATPRWQLLRHRFQKAIAEGASTSQVTAISVLASIYLQAVIAATMEEVEIFLSALTARSKVREVLRGLVATRQVHTISLGHSPHFYVAGTLPEFSVPTSIYASIALPASAYFMRTQDADAPEIEALQHDLPAAPQNAPAEKPQSVEKEESVAPRAASARPAARKPAAAGKSAAARPHFSRPASHSRDRKSAQPSAASRPARRSADARPASSGTASASRAGATARPGSGARPAKGARPAASTRWNGSAPASANGKHKPAPTSNGNGSHKPKSVTSANGKHKPATPAWNARSGNGATKPVGKTTGKPGTSLRGGAAPTRNGAAARNGSRTPTLAAGTKAGAGNRYGYTARPNANAKTKQGTKKRG